MAKTNDLITVISQSKPDVILLDFGFQQHPFYLVDKIASDFPKSAIVALLSESEMVNLDRVVLSGARAFLQYPFQSEKLVIIINRVLELLERHQNTPTESNAMENIINAKNTYTVFSPKGGAGTTTVAINLAISLQKELKEDVLLIDGKHLFGHVALFLNLFTGNSITDLIGGLCPAQSEHDQPGAGDQARESVQGRAELAGGLPEHHH